MNLSRLSYLLDRFAHTAVAVVGDFFLDKYLEIDPALTEVSLETGLEAHQVVAVRAYPGAAGTIVNNLCALGVGRVVCIGVVGGDGEGFDLARGLRRMGAETSGLFVRPDRLTPTYRKPLVREADGRLRELERLDSRTRERLPAEAEDSVIAALSEAAAEVKAVVALDQVPERDCGVITGRVREALAELAERRPEVVWLGDSRTRVGEYRNLMVKSNREEACRAVHPDSSPHEGEAVEECVRALAARVGRPAFVTVGAQGILYAAADHVEHIPAPPVTGEIDIVGAGDAAAAALAASLSVGASPTEAAVVANLAASITIQQIGVTGTASQEQIKRRFAEHEDLWRKVEEKQDG